METRASHRRPPRRAQGAPARPAACRLGARILAATLMLASLPAAGCAPEVEVEGRSKLPMARQAVRLFLENLQRGDYVEAARYYAGPLEPLRQARPDLAPDDLPALLEGFLQAGERRIESFRIEQVRMLDPFCYPVTVVFESTGPEAPIRREFRVYYDGRSYRVLGLPPLAPTASPGSAGGAA